MAEPNDPALLDPRPGAALSGAESPRAAALAAEITRIHHLVSVQAAGMDPFDEPASFPTALRDLA